MARLSWFDMVPQGERVRTLTEVAVNALLVNDQKTLSALAKRASDLAHDRIECPECGDKSSKDHNGDRYDPQFLCHACGYVFNDPNGPLG